MAGQARAQAALLITAACIAQFAMLVYAPWQLVPTTPLWESELVTISRSVSGQPVARFRIQRSDAEPILHANAQAIGDLVAGASPEVAAAFVEDFEEVVCDGPEHPAVIDRQLFLPEFQAIMAHATSARLVERARECFNQLDR